MIRKWLSFRTLSIALAVILSVTAALKFHFLLTDPFADIKSGTSLPLLWLAVFAEAGVVWIVVSQAPDQLKWLSLISLFGIMTAVSTYNVLTGQTSCGCAGAIDIHPMWPLTLDVIVIVMLIGFRPRSVSEGTKVTSIPLTTLGQVVGFAVVAIVFVLFQTPAARALVRSKILGHEIEAIPVHFGTVEITDKLNCQLQLRNHNAIARKIVGVGKSCTCVIPQDVVHASIPGNGTLEIAIGIKPKNAGPFHQRVLFYLDSPQQFVVAADFFVHFREK